MTYLIAADLPDLPAGRRFRELLARPEILQIPAPTTVKPHCNRRRQDSRPPIFPAPR